MRSKYHNNLHIIQVYEPLYIFCYACTTYALEDRDMREYLRLRIQAENYFFFLPLQTGKNELNDGVRIIISKIA